MIIKDKIVRFKQWDCLLNLDHYASGGATAIELIDAQTKEPIARATVNITEWTPPGPEYTLIKDWSENEGMIDCLLLHNVIALTGQVIRTGYVHAPIVKINPEIMEQFMPKYESMDEVPTEEFEVYGRMEDGSEEYIGTVELYRYKGDSSDLPIEIEIDGVVYYPQF